MVPANQIGTCLGRGVSVSRNAEPNLDDPLHQPRAGVHLVGRGGRDPEKAKMMNSSASVRHESERDSREGGSVTFVR